MSTLDGWLWEKLVYEPQSPDDMYEEVTDAIFGDPEKNETITDIKITFETVRLPQMRLTLTTWATHTKVDIATMGNNPVSNFIARNESLLSREQAHVFSYQWVTYQLFLKYNTTTKWYEARFVEPLSLMVTPGAFAAEYTYDATQKQLTYKDSAGVAQTLKLKYTYATTPYDLWTIQDASWTNRERKLQLEGNEIRIRCTKIPDPIDISQLPPGRLVELRGAEVLKKHGLHVNIKDGTISFLDASNTTVLEIHEPDYASTMQKIKAVYQHNQLLSVWEKSYQVRLISLGAWKASLELKEFWWWFTSFSEEVLCFDVSGNAKQSSYKTAYTPHPTDWKQSSVDIVKNWKILGSIRFRDLSPQEQAELSNTQAGKYLTYMSIEWSWKQVAVVNQDREGGVGMGDLDKGLYNTTVTVKNGEGTTWSWVASIFMNKEKQIDYVRIGRSWEPTTFLDNAFIRSLQKFGATATKEREDASWGKYKVVAKNSNGNLEMTVITVQQPKKDNLADEANKNHQPIPPLVPPKPKKEDDESDHQEDEEEHEYEDDYPDDADIPPSRLEEKNPWWDSAINVERMKRWLTCGDKEIIGFYEYPKPFMGATRDDLKGFYIDHEGDGTFTLMYNVSGPRNDDQWESHKINIKKNPQLLNGQSFSVQDDDKGEWMVRLYVSPDKKLGFFLRPPLKTLAKKDGGYEIGRVDGPPTVLNYPTDDPWAYIFSGMDAGGIQSKTKPRKWHRWVDVPWTFETLITAPASAKVVYVHDGEKNNAPSDFYRNKSGWYSAGSWWWNYIILQLPNNCYVRLGHLSPGTFMVKEWDVITRGQPLGKMWRSGHIWTSNPWRSNWWVHVHIEYFRLEDSYLNASDDDYKKLFKPLWWFRSKVKQRFDPEVYLTKEEVYDAPVNSGWSTWWKEPSPEVRTGKRERINPPNWKAFPKEVVGDTPQKRLDAFITYMWYDVAYLHQLADREWLDHALLPAIIWAEHGKWPPANNNPGNIMKGNQIKSYGSLQEWLSAMAEVLNNRYQSANMTIWSLNGYGRKLAWMPSCTAEWQYCYAYDTKWDWHINVTNFMSFVYDAKVDYTYKFRRRTAEKQSGSYEEYLRKQPKERVSASFSYDGAQYNSYMPKLSPTHGKDTRKAPWWWLIQVDGGVPYLVTPQTRKPLSSKRVEISWQTYTITVTQNSKDPLFPKAAEFSLTPQ